MLFYVAGLLIQQEACLLLAGFLEMGYLLALGFDPELHPTKPHPARKLG